MIIKPSGSKKDTFQNPKRNKILLKLSIFTSLYWFIGKITDVYRFAFTGAVFELFWLPMLASILLLPLISILFFIQDKFNPRSMALYSILMFISSILILLLQQ